MLPVDACCAGTCGLEASSWPCSRPVSFAASAAADATSRPRSTGSPAVSLAASTTRSEISPIRSFSTLVDGSRSARDEPHRDATDPEPQRIPLRRVLHRRELPAVGDDSRDLVAHARHRRLHRLLLVVDVVVHAGSHVRPVAQPLHRQVGRPGRRRGVTNRGRRRPHQVGAARDRTPRAEGRVSRVSVPRQIRALVDDRVLVGDRSEAFVEATHPRSPRETSTGCALHALHPQTMPMTQSFSSAPRGDLVAKPSHRDHSGVPTAMTVGTPAPCEWEARVSP